MSQQPKALRLVDELIDAHNGHSDEGPTTFSEAADELRHLYAANRDCMAWFESTKAERDTLLTALEQIANETRSIGSAHIIARAAIASVKGGAA